MRMLAPTSLCTVESSYQALTLAQQNCSVNIIHEAIITALETVTEAHHRARLY